MKDSSSQTAHPNPVFPGGEFGLLRDRSYEAMRVGIWQFARTVERHFARLAPAEERYLQAKRQGNLQATQYEKETVLALLYEIADTVFMTIQQLDLNSLHLESSADGLGLTGEDATFVFNLLELLERTCARTLNTARRLELELNFQQAVDELKGITYTQHAHWKDLIPGSPKESFFAHFQRSQRAITERLNEKAKFLRNRTWRHALAKANRPALREMIERLENARFPAIGLTAMIEKESSLEDQHLWLSRAKRAALQHVSEGSGTQKS